MKRVVAATGARAVATDDIYVQQADVFAPCALGGVIDDETLRRLRAGVVAGSANNQLRDERHGDALEDSGVTYAPDYVANAGGIINGCRELLGWTVEQAATKVNEIYDTTLTILRRAAEAGIPAHRMADRPA